MPRLVCSAALLLALAATAWAQPQQQAQFQRFERQLEELQRDTRLQINPDFTAVQRALVEYGGYITFSYYSIDDQLGHSHVLRQTEGIAYARINVDEVHQFFLRGSTTYLDFKDGDDFDGQGDDWVEPTLDRAIYRFDLQRYMAAYEGRIIDSNLIIQGGRQLVHWANGLTLSDEIDGALVTLSHGPWSLDLLAGLRRESVFDIDPFRPGANGETDRTFYGGMLSYALHPKHTLYAYGLVQEDHNDRDSITDPDDPTRAVFFEYESFYVGGGINGGLGDRWLYATEFVYEGGESLSRLPNAGQQTHEDIEAFAADVRLDYLLLDENRTRLQFEATVASGDSDRSLYTNSSFGGNKSGTADHAFNSFGLIKTGLAFSPAISNLVMLRGGVSTFPLPNSNWLQRLQVGVDMFVYNKFDDDAPISERTSDAGYLGFETDLYANWQITSDLSLALRYGFFVPGEAMQDVPDASSSGEVRHFIYSGLTIGF